MLPAAPAGAITFLMGGPIELVRARAVPSPDHLPGPLRDAARAARRAVTTYDEIHAAGRALVDRRREVHAEDERNAARADGRRQAITARRSYSPTTTKSRTRPNACPPPPARSSTPSAT